MSKLKVDNIIHELNITLYKQRLVCFSIGNDIEYFDLDEHFIKAKSAYKGLIVSKDSRKALAKTYINVVNKNNVIATVITDSLGAFILSEELKLDTFQLSIKTNDSDIIKDVSVNRKRANYIDVIILE